MKRTLILFALACAVFYAGTARTAEASCITSTDQDKFDRANLVGIGRVTDLSAGGPYITFTALFKADPPLETNQILVLDGPEVTTVDVNWQRNAVYLLYLQSTVHPKQFTTSVCAGTRLYEGRYTESELVSLGVTTRGPLPLPPDPQKMINTSPATTFSIEDYYPSYFNDGTEDWPRVSLYYLFGLIITGLFLLILVVQQGHHVGTPEAARQYGRWAIVVLVVIALAGFFLLFQPLDVEYSVSDLPFYAIFTTPALATLGCADLGRTISNLVILSGMAGLIIITLIAIWLLLFPERAKKHPFLPLVLVSIYLFLAILPLVGVGIEQSMPSGC